MAVEPIHPAPASPHLPPHNNEAEQSVLGAMLLSKDAIGEVIEAHMVRIGFMQARAQPLLVAEAIEAKAGAQLKAGKPALDAVTAAITVLEDAPQFNAGRGAVFTHDGKNELDSSIMDGATGKAGAVAGLHRVKNPITLARTNGA